MGRYADLFWMLTRTEFRLRDQGTLGGFLWTLLHPLFMFLILYAVFTRMMGSKVENYAAYLLIGVVQWNFFAAATSGGLTSLRRKAGLISHFRFPRVLIVLSSVVAILLSHLLEWLVLLVGLLALGLRPGAGWLLLPGIIVVEAALAAGLSCLLSVAAVHLRDLERAWGIALFGLFFLTPVFYAGDLLGAGGRLMLYANPVAAVIEATRGLLIGPPPTSLAVLAPAAAVSLTLLAGGVLAFPRLSRGIVERL
ncbi:MAG: ABC transporter permease [Elusimicrobiota bacterium]|jgi:ABC-type polysaccharide/polyol phosphate export permease